MTPMNFPTLPSDHVTNSFLLEICFWGPTYPTYLYDVTLFSLFFLNASLNNSCGKELKRQQIFKYDPCPSSPSVSSYSKVQTVQDKREYFELPT